MAHPDHDQVIGRLAGARLRGPAEVGRGGARAAEAHPDAETWAAYVDGGLRPDEVRGLEAHLAGCAPCRRLVVALAPEVSSAAGPAARGAEPVGGPAQVIPFPRRQVFAWMGIAASLFAAVTLWSVSRLGRDVPVAQVAVLSPPLADAPAAAPAAPAPTDSAVASPRAAVPAELDRRKADADRSPASGGAAAVPPPAAPPAEDKRIAAAAPAVRAPAPAVAVDTRQIQLQTNTVAAGAARARGPLATQANTQQQNVAAGSAPSQPVSAPIAEPLPVPAPPTAAAPSPAAPARADAAPPVQAGAAAAGELERRGNEAPVGGLAEMVVTAEAPGARREAARPARGQAGADRSRAAASKDEAAKTLAFGAAAPAALPSFAEPGGRLLWRIADGRILESSSDGGTTWRGRHTVGRGERLRAGTAPAIDSAWAVGDRGLVLRLVVPGGWSAVSRPADVSLIAVSASGPQSARVTAADGRVFETTDGGATWTPAAGPQ